MPQPIILRWPNRQPAHEQLIATLAPDRVVGDEPIPGAVTRGLWPGVRPETGRRGEGVFEAASASAEPWVDSNGYLAAYERALHPERVPLLAEQHKNPEEGVPDDTLELALVEARVHGGNFVLTPPAAYRQALERADPKALDAWQSLARTAKWLNTNEALFAAPAVPSITAIVEQSMPNSEIANLLHRRGGSPLLTASVPPPDPARTLVLVAAALKQVPAAAYEHAAAGAIVVIDGKLDLSLKLVKEESDRITYAHGKGQVVAYRKRIANPSDFALDIIDLVGYRRRPARLWNASTAIPYFTQNATLHLIQYGSPLREEVQARVLGHYSRATLLRPEAPPMELKTGRRGLLTEVFPKGIRRLGIVKFEK